MNAFKQLGPVLPLSQYHSIAQADSMVILVPVFLSLGLFVCVRVRVYEDF